MKVLGFEISRQKKQKTNFTAKQTTDRKLKINKLDKQIIDKIVNQFKDQSRKDIQKWRKALLMAENPEKPRRHFLQDLYKDLGTDGHLKSLIRLRKYTTLNTAFYITDDKDKLNEDATRFLNKKWFYDFLGIALDSIFYGYTLVEFESFGDKSANLHIIPRRNVVPEQKVVIPDLTKDEFISYDDDYFANWLIEIGDAGDLGILNDIVPNLIWKRNVGQSWADFTEKFGIPMITAETTAYDDETIDKIDYMLSQIGEASRGVFPQGTTITFQEADRTDAFQSYEHFIKYNKEEISVAIVGGTMITNDGSSRSQSEVHERNLDEKIAQADKRDLAFLINDYLLPLLRNQGYSFIGENDQFVFAKEHNLKLNEYWNIVKDIINEYEVDEKWLSDTFFVPITGKKKRQNLQPIAQLIAGYENIKLPDYPTESDTGDFIAGDNTSAILNKLQAQLAKAIWEKINTLPAQAQIVAEETKDFFEGLTSGWGKRRIEAAWGEPDHLMLAMMEYNLFEFSSTKTEARLAAMSQLYIDKDKLKLRGFEAFKKEAEKVTKNFNENWLRAEYNLAVATGQNAASYARFISEKDTVTPYVQYQTAGDERVRSSHQLLDGKIFNLSDKEAMRLWPPNGYGCRCEMVQYVGNSEGRVSKGKEFTGKMPPDWTKGFDFNRGDLKQVFSRKQFYSKGENFINKLTELTYDKYKLRKWKEIAAEVKQELKLDKTITGDNIAELFKATGKDKNGNEFMEFKDYLNRKLGLFKKTFNTHTKGKYLNENELRHQLFPYVKDVLKNPDEVWMTESSIKNKYQIRYIKYFNNEAVIVDTVLNLDMGMEIKTWYRMKQEEIFIRKGLLINNKPF